MKKFIYPILILVLVLALALSALVHYWQYRQNAQGFKDTIKERIGRAEHKPLPNSAVYAYHFLYDSITPIQALQGADTQGATILADTQLLVTPGIYTIEGNTYRFDKEGLYRVMRPSYYARQIVVCKNDFFSMLSAASWIVTHGTRDNKLSFDKWYKKACREKIVVTCSRASIFGGELLKLIGLRTRKVQCFSSTTKTQFFNAHVMMEVLHPVTQKWFLVDIDNNRYFTVNGEPINAHEFYDCLQQNKPYQWVSLAKDDWLDAPGYMNGMINENLLSESVLHQWYKDVLEHIVINDAINCSIDFDSVKKANPTFEYADSAALREKLYGPDACR